VGKKVGSVMRMSVSQRPCPKKRIIGIVQTQLSYISSSINSDALRNGTVSLLKML